MTNTSCQQTNEKPKSPTHSANDKEDQDISQQEEADQAIGYRVRSRIAQDAGHQAEREDQEADSRHAPSVTLDGSARPSNLPEQDRQDLLPKPNSAVQTRSYTLSKAARRGCPILDYMF